MDSNGDNSPQVCRTATPFPPFGRCPAHWLIRQIADRWSLPVLSALQSTPMRFTELLHALQPVSRKMLDRTLKRLTQIGLVVRSTAQDQVYYELTDLGRTLNPPLWRILRWSRDHLVARAADLPPPKP